MYNGRVTIRIGRQTTVMVVTSKRGDPVVRTFTVLGTAAIADELVQADILCGCSMVPMPRLVFVVVRKSIWPSGGAHMTYCPQFDRHGLPIFTRTIVWPHRPGNDGLYFSDDLGQIMRVPLDNDGVRRIDRLFRLEDDHYVEFDPMTRGKAVTHRG